jgi:hypothetical protein
MWCTWLHGTTVYTLYTSVKARCLPEVGKVTLKSNGDEELSDDSLKKSNGDEALNDYIP